MSDKERELETENWRLRGELADYESAVRKAHEVIHEMQHILERHKDEVTWGTLDTDGTLKDRKIDALTKTRKETLEQAIEKAKDFCRTAPKPDE